MKALHQYEHEAINARSYPGTRQLCISCEEPTERCEEDAIYTEGGEGPLCVDCWHKAPNYTTQKLQTENEHLREALEKFRGQFDNLGGTGTAERALEFIY